MLTLYKRQVENVGGTICPHLFSARLAPFGPLNLEGNGI